MAMGHIIGAPLDHSKILRVEINFTFIIVNEESNYVVSTYKTKKLRLFIGRQCDECQIILIDDLDCIKNFGINIQINKIRLW